MRKLLSIALVLCGGAAGQDAQVRLGLFAEGFSRPTAIAHAGDGSGRVFVVEQAGRIRAVGGDGSVSTFLDIAGRVRCCGERGLLGLAFPPDFSQSRRFYLYYTDLNGDIVVSRFSGRTDGSGDPQSEQVLLTIPHRQFANHNGGALVFGPDGFLYVGTGDGGGGGDPLGNGQNSATLLGAVLRLDVSGAGGYTTPPANPFVGRAGFREELWAYGLRNPWRISFDRMSGDFYIADVGQNRAEEINFQPANDPGGQNYGWNRMEGLSCYQTGCSQSGLTLPVWEYRQGSGDCSVTGGYVYRGRRAPSLTGTYVYGDFCSGRVWALSRVNGRWENRLVVSSGLAISTFGETESGDLLMADHSRGAVYRFESAAPFTEAEAVVNAASFAQGISPGSLVSLFGSGFAGAGQMSRAEGFPLPDTLGGVQVLVNGVPAALLAVAETAGGNQVNFQAPWNLAPGDATVRISRDGRQSAPVAVRVLAQQPGLFVVNGFAAALGQDGRALAVCGQTCPEVAPGEVVQLFGTGLGEVPGAPATGQPAPQSPLLRVAQLPAVTVGGVEAEVVFAGLAPGFAGLYQINIRLAVNTPGGEQDVVVRVRDAVSPAAKLRVRR